MTVISLDLITKNILLKRGYSLHYYLQFLVYLKDGLRIISEDDIQTIRYKVLTLNSNNALDLPDDYLDYAGAGVSIRSGQYLYPLVEEDCLDLVPNYDADFVIQPYSSGVATATTAAQQSIYYNGYLSPYWTSYNWNAYGENMGRQFGGVGALPDTFKVNKARNEIKINEYLTNTEYVLEYISDGMDADSATHIVSYAQECLEAYAMWQFKENNRTYGAGEAQMAKQDYIQERQILRARLSDLTIDKLKRIVQINTIGVKQ